MIEPEPLWEIHSKTKRASGAKRTIEMTIPADLISLLKEYPKNIPNSKERIEIETNIIEKLSKSCWWKRKELIDLFSQEIQAINFEFEAKLSNLLNTKLSKKFDSAKMAEILIKEARLLKREYQKKLVTDNFVNTLAFTLKTKKMSEAERFNYKRWLYEAIETKFLFNRERVKGNLKISRQESLEAEHIAKEDTFSSLMKKINIYEEERDFLAWFRYIFWRRFRTAAKKIIDLRHSQTNKEEGDRIIVSPEDPNSHTFSNLEGNYEKEFNRNLRYEQLLEKLRKHPELNKPFPRNRPGKTIADFIIEHKIEGKKISELSKEWGVRKTTMYSFFDNKTRKSKFEKLKPYLAEILSPYNN